MHRETLIALVRELRGMAGVSIVRRHLREATQFRPRDGKDIDDMIAAVLEEMAASDDECVHAAGVIADDLAWPKDIVLAFMREAKKRGLVRHTPLVDLDEYRPRGSGYQRTAHGDEAVYARRPIYLKPEWRCG